MSTSPPRRGRPPRHSLDDVVGAATAIADVDGLEAVTMRAVATRLGAGVMSLYSYVPDKRALVQAMVERVGEDYALLPGPTGDWRVDVHRLARAQRSMAHRHPWLIDAAHQVTAVGPGTLAYLEAALAALEPTGLDATARLETAALITGFTLNVVRAELTRRASGTQDPDEIATQGVELARLLGTGRYPRLAAALGPAPLGPAPLPAPFSVDAEFGRLLDRLLDGLVPAARTC